MHSDADSIQRQALVVIAFAGDRVIWTGNWTAEDPGEVQVHEACEAEAYKRTGKDEPYTHVLAVPRLCRGDEGSEHTEDKVVSLGKAEWTVDLMSRSSKSGSIDAVQAWLFHCIAASNIALVIDVNDGSPQMSANLLPAQQTTVDKSWATGSYMEYCCPRCSVAGHSP